MCCFLCGKYTDYHVYQSERGEEKEYRTCKECEEELQR
jgi:hypothetical protein